MNPTLFIGSSVEGLTIANRVKTALLDIADINIWTTANFSQNKSTLDSLLRFANVFDFGIFVATADDASLKRDSIQLSARDNVIFEFGIFLGSLGGSNAFALIDNDLDLPSDLFGITLNKFDLKEARESHLDLDRAIGSLRSRIETEIPQLRYRLLPSTVLAISYFDNFVNRIAGLIGYTNRISAEGKEYNPATLTIVLPDDFDGTMDQKRRSLIDLLHAQSIKLKDLRTGRDINVDAVIIPSSGGLDELHMYDLPTTLSGIDSAIETIFGERIIGKTAEQELIEKKEVIRFKRVLETKIKFSGYSKNVEVKFLSQLIELASNTG